MATAKPRPLGQAASERAPTQAELDAEFQAQLDAEFLAQQQAPVQGPPVAATIPEGAGLADPRFLGPPGQRQTLAGHAMPGVVEMAQQGALPALGAGLGSLAGPIGGPVFAPMGAMAGEAANQLLGITPPDAEAIGVAGMATGIPIPANLGIRGATRVSRAGRVVAQEVAVEEARRVHDFIRIAQSADDLYRFARQMQGDIPILPFQRAIAPFRDAESKITDVVKATGPMRAIEEIEAMAFARGGQVDAVALAENVKRWGQKLREARAASSPDAGAWAQLYKAGRDTLETAGQGPGNAAAAYKAAAEAFRREEVKSELQDMIARVIPAPRAGDNAVQVGRLGVVLDAIEGTKPQFAQFRTDFTKSVTPEERKAITDELRRLNKTRPLPAATGVERGSGRDLPARVAAGAVGAGVGKFVAGTEGAFYGAGAGVLLADKAAEIISDALLSPTARPLLIRFLKTGPLTRHELALLNAAVAAGTPATVRAARGEGRFPIPR